ncbi:MAG: hypothetical protein ACP6IU_11845 [Candidatus Asgardarchaeia archaeon]
MAVSRKKKISIWDVKNKKKVVKLKGLSAKHGLFLLSCILAVN